MRTMSNVAPTPLQLPTPDRQHLTGLAFGMGAGAAWGLVFLAPELTREFSPMLQSAARYLCYGLIALALLAPRWSTLFPSLRRQQWLNLAWLALTGNALYYLLIATAVQNGGAGMTALVQGFLPVVVTVIGSRARRAVPLRRLVPSMLFCVAGAAFIGWQTLATPGATAVGQQLLGLFCAFGALGMWTVFTVSNSRCLRRWRNVSSYDWSLLVGMMAGAQSLLLLPIALLLSDTSQSGEAWVRFGLVSASVAVVASVIGNSLWNRMSRLLPLTLAGQMLVFETIFAMIYCFLWEQRLPTFLELAALTAVILGVLSCFAAHRPPTQAQTVA